jgi:ribose-phosphate pyrophosphokinase
MTRSDPILFALGATRPLGERIGAHLGVPPGVVEARTFDDGERTARPATGVRDRDVYVIHSLSSSADATVNDKLVELLLFCATVRDASAARVTAVLPYLCYARKERRTGPGEPVSSRYVATLIEASGVDRVVTVDVHDLAAYQNGFRIVTEHLEARPLFVDRFARRELGEVAVVSPDVGGIKRAERFRSDLERALGRPVGAGFVPKVRHDGVEGRGEATGPVAGCDVILFDDMISTGATLRRAAEACRRAGARRVSAAATHGLFVAGAVDTLAEARLDEILVTNTVGAGEHDALALDRLHRIDAAPLLGEAITRMHA